MRISFGPFAFDPESRLLWREGTEVPLPPRVLGVLEVLIDRQGQVVARQDLLDRVWKDAFVTDTSLAEAVSFLRQALGDDPQSPRYIQTVHRRGYRFLPPLAPEPPDLGQTTPERVDWQLVPWSIAALCAGLAIAAVWHMVTAPVAQPPPVSRLEVRAAHGTAFDLDAQPIAIAADGRTLAWSACESATGRCAIYVRPVDHLEAQPLAGTDGGHMPAFSPDGRWIAFFADGALKKIASAGGAATTLAPASDPGGAAWTSDGRILFAPSAASGVAVIGPDAGTADVLTRPAADRGELRHRSPASIGETRRGDALAFTIACDPDHEAPGTLAFVAPDTTGVRAVRPGVHRAAPAGHSYLLLETATDLQVATFDDRTLVLTGATDSVPAPPGEGVAHFAVGGSTLSLVRAPSPRQRIWADGAGAGALARFTSLVISPDSRRAAGVVTGHNASDIWIADLGAGTATRMTFSGTNVSPAWSGDGRQVLYAAREGSAAFHAVARAASDRAVTATPIPDVPAQTFPTSAAGNRVALTRYKDGHTAVLLRDGNGPARVLSEGPYDEAAGALSPDARWVALESGASGRIDVIVRSADDGRRVAVVSPDGGRQPRWSADGRTIYFVSGRRLMKAAFAADGSPATGVPQAILDRAGERAVAVTPSGRILVDRQPEPDTAVIVLEWLHELRKRLPLPVNAPR